MNFHFKLERAKGGYFFDKDNVLQSTTYIGSDQNEQIEIDGIEIHKTFVLMLNPFHDFAKKNNIKKDMDGHFPYRKIFDYINKDSKKYNQELESEVKDKIISFANQFGFGGYDEVEGVMAHELAHVKNRDTLIMTVTATIAGALSMLANFALFFGNNRNNPLGIIGTIAVMILAPIAAMLVQMAISRTREYGADAGGAEICGNPMWLASALKKLEQGATTIDNDVAEDNPATAHMFIVNPLHSISMDSLFSTHPKTANRVQKLRDLAGVVGRPWG